MYLREIAINGFKSFADRSKLDIGRGVTAVVGPNGCGKSNIVDALRWVLGEQSAKALRGGSMQEVIFQGSDKRKPLPFCEVALTFADCERELGTAFNEVEISRRVSREGGSEYFINGKASRLKDIQRLFANTGVGRVSYSFMVQGQIDQILSTHAGERRVIFEEAAGITLYKNQRKEALSKLGQVETNLNRVTDVIEEVDRQIKSLKRQASKALRYQRIKHRLTHLDLAYSAFRFSALRASIDELGAEAEKRSVEVAANAQALEASVARLDALKTERKAVYDRMQEAQQRVYALRSEKENAESQGEFADIRAADIEAQIESYQTEITGLEARQHELTERVRNESENKQQQLDLVGDSDKVFKARSDELVAAQQALAELESQLQDRRQDRLTGESRIARARSNCTTLEVNLKTFQVKHGVLNDTFFNLKQEVETLDDGLKKTRRLLENRRGERAECERALQTATGESTTILKEFRSIQETIQEEDRQVARKTAQLSMLESMQAKFEGFGEGAKAILGGQLGDLVEASAMTVMSRELTCTDRWRGALEILLGSAAEAIHVSDPRQALKAIGKLDADLLGRACIQIPMQGPSAAAQAEALPDGIVAALSVVNVRKPELEAALTRLLEGCYFATDIGSFVAHLEANPGFPFFLAATPNGEVIDRRGVLFGGRASGKKSPGVIEREEAIRVLKSELKQLRQSIAKRREQAAAAEERRAESEERVETARRRLNELAGEVSGLETELRSLEQKLDQNRQSRERSEAELETLEASRAEAVAALERARGELSDAEADLAKLRVDGETLETRIVEARGLCEQRREALADVRLELAEKRQRLESLDRALGEFERESADLISRVRGRRQEIDTLHGQIDELRAQAAKSRDAAVEIGKTLAITTAALDSDRAALGEKDASIAALEKDLAAQRTQGRATEQSLNQLEVRLAEQRSQIGFIETGARDEYQVDLGEVIWKQELWAADAEFQKRLDLDAMDDPDQVVAQPKGERKPPTAEALEALENTDWSQVEAEVHELKGRIASMGPVNTDAISEYADLRERHDFLKHQSEDLWNSKEALIKAIDEINETSQTLFRDTFEQIRKNFQFTYEKLSGGGVADLELVDSEDPLDSGIEIIARPPGTRLKSVSLLSGGQRTMTAVALLFAIYLVKPSPFCVLDEIDAALDDANIGRFCETLKGFTKNSQFLIVTHNKRTISNADAVFGVTMPEKGVSTLISMRFSKDVNAPVAAPA